MITLSSWIRSGNSYTESLSNLKNYKKIYTPNHSNDFGFLSEKEFKTIGSSNFILNPWYSENIDGGHKKILLGRDFIYRDERLPTSHGYWFHSYDLKDYGHYQVFILDN